MDCMRNVKEFFSVTSEGNIPEWIKISILENLVQVKDYTIGVYYFSDKHVQHYWVRAETDWPGIRIMCPIGETRLPAGLSFEAGCRRNSTYTLYSAAGYFLCIKDKKCVIP